jgi:hypothetical protein
MSENQRDQPPLPFEPALQLVSRSADAGSEREVSLDAFTSILFDEFIRRSAALNEPESRA